MKAAKLDQVNAVAAATGTTPAQSLDLLQDMFNALLARLDLTQSFRLLLAKLDADGGVTDTNYGSTLAPRSDADVLTQFTALLAKLDLDGGVTPTDFASTLAATAATLPTQFTALLAKLDGAGGVTDTDYAATIPTSQFVTLFKVVPLDSQ